MELNVLYNEDCIEGMRKLPENSVDSVITDPPYHLTQASRNGSPRTNDPETPFGRTRLGERGFMGKTWDGGDIAHRTELWSEVLRVLKPGGHLLSFGGSRTYHRMASAIEDAGFEIRDQLMWIYGCLSDDTEVLVDGEWVHYHSAKQGRLALAYNATTNEFSWQPIEQCFEYRVSDTAYRIESDSTDQIVSRNHRCLVEREGALVFDVAENVAREREARVPVLENVSDLLSALPLPYERTSGAKGDMLANLCRESHQRAQVPRKEAFPSTKDEKGQLYGLRQTGIQARVLVKKIEGSDVFPRMQWESARAGVGGIRVQRSGGMDRAVGSIVCGEDERREESSVEGRGNILPQTWKLQADQVRTLSIGVCGNGSQGRLCDGTQADRGEAAWSMLAARGSGTSRYARPAEQRAENIDVVQEQQRPQAVRASRFTRTDLARVTPFHYEGIVWCIQVPTGAFVARRNGKVFITGNSGFPKSLDVSKALDKTAGAEREVVGTTWGKGGQNLNQLARINGNDQESAKGCGAYGLGAKQIDIELAVTVAATPEAKQWQGWGTALKPSHEPIVLARKPLSEGTVAANVLKHGTGAINIDASRIEARESTKRPSGINQGVYGNDNRHGMIRGGDSGRWPANVMHDGSDEVLQFFPSAPGQLAPVSGNEPSSCTKNAYGERQRVPFNAREGETTSAARFFYCAKASKRERGEGNGHPTVKPIALMEYLVRLITPPGGVVLDPFAGSGTTLLACAATGSNYIGFERDPSYFAIAQKRIAEHAPQLSLVG